MPYHARAHLLSLLRCDGWQDLDLSQYAHYGITRPFATHFDPVARDMPDAVPRYAQLYSSIMLWRAIESVAGTSVDLLSPEEAETQDYEKQLQRHTHPINTVFVVRNNDATSYAIKVSNFPVDSSTRGKVHVQAVRKLNILRILFNFM